MKRWSSLAIAEFAEQIADLLKAGIPLIESLHLLRHQYSGRKRDDLSQLAQAIEEGEPIADAFKKISFPHHFISIIGVSEAHGHLSDSFFNIGSWIRRKVTFRKKIVAKLFYPIFLLIFSLVLMILFLFVIFPRFKELFNRFNTELPPSMQLLFNLHEFIENHYLSVIRYLIVFVVLVLFSILYLQHRKRLLPFLFRLPILKSLLQIRYTHFFASQLGLLLGAGIGIWEALNLIVQRMPYKPLREPFLEVQHHILAGKPLSTLRLSIPIFHPDFYRSVYLGENQGTLHAQLIVCSQLMEKRIERRMVFLLKWLEPISLLLLGGFITLIVLSLFIPLIQSLQMI